jgi:hypothetical protein
VWLIVGACLSMAVRDSLATLLVVAEARGRAVLAGLLDAAGDIAGIAVMVLGAGEVIVHGLNAQTLAVLAALMVTSFFTTLAATTVGRRIK